MQRHHSRQNQIIRDAADLLDSFEIKPLLTRLVEINQPLHMPPALPDIGPSAKGSHDRVDGQTLNWFSRQVEIMQEFAELSCIKRPAAHGLPFLVDLNGQRCLIITHLFSGRRRIGDCHDWIERLQGQFLPGWRIILLSFDTAVHPQVGDLNNGPNWQRVLKLGHLGVTAANLTGPPCETYSAARHIPPPQIEGGRHKRWPRPLRHPDRLWGLDGLGLRELQQLCMGTRLLLHSVHFESLVVLHGGGSMMEHPAPRRDPKVPASWGSPAIKKLTALLPDSHPHYVEQYKFGAKGVKPTWLRSLNLPQFQALHQAEDSSIARPVQGLSGLDEEGQWRTAHAKEYPSALCKGMAIGVLKSLQYKIRRNELRERSWSVLEEILPWIEEVTWASMDILAAQGYLPDYQGQ